ncbi:hypothetical protein ACHQM5_014627 [Ranunculus cassubicifolius]
MLPKTWSNSSLCEDASASSGTTRVHDFSNLYAIVPTSPKQQLKKKRNLPGNPEPNAEVIALSPRSLLATNRFVCEVCSKGFQRDQNLQLHRRGHNLPWKLQKREGGEYRKKVYVCPEASCVHHSPSRALGDLTGIKKHFCRKHREKRLKCHKCSKMYAVESDYKAHAKVCGTREIRCDCGRVFSRKDKYEIHKPFCDALAQEAGRVHSITPTETSSPQQNQPTPSPIYIFSNQNPNPVLNLNSTNDFRSNLQQQIQTIDSPFLGVGEHTPPAAPPANVPHNTAYLSATAVLQQAATLGAGSLSSSTVQSQSLGLMPGSSSSSMNQFGILSSGPVNQFRNHQNGVSNTATWRNTDCPTRDFLGLGRDGGGNAFTNNKDYLSLTGAVYFQTYARDHLMLTPRFGFGDTWVGDY